MSIRFANKNDIPQMLELLLQVGAVHHEIRPDLFKEGAQKYDAASLCELLQDSTRPIFCYEQDGKMVGYCFCILEITENNPVLCDQKTLYIDDLCVDQSIRGSGAAKALYDAVTAYAKEIGCTAITLNVWNGNDRAMRFYEKCGLKPRKVYMETML